MNWQTDILPQKFYDRDPITVAKKLLGKFLIRKQDDKYLVGIITETEAYLSEGDSAAHNFKGKNERNKSLYKEAGHAYIHSMRGWNLLDVVTEGIDVTNDKGEIFIAQDNKDAIHEIITTGRVGISNAKDMPLRFYINKKI